MRYIRSLITLLGLAALWIVGSSVAQTPAAKTITSASTPPVGIGHFAGSTLNITSSAVNLAGGSNEVTGILPLANLPGDGTTWITLPVATPNVIKDFGGGLQTGQYQKDATGRVWVRGIMTCVTTSTIAANTTYWTFPSGYRPPTSTITAIELNGNVLNDLNVTTAGVVNNRTAWVCTSGTNYMVVEFSFSVN